MIIAFFGVARIRFCSAETKNPAMSRLQLMNCGFVSNPRLAATLASECRTVPMVRMSFKAKPVTIIISSEMFCHSLRIYLMREVISPSKLQNVGATLKLDELRFPR